jgi:hypothetical protein
MEGRRPGGRVWMASHSFAAPAPCAAPWSGPGTQTAYSAQVLLVSQTRTERTRTAARRA